MTQTVLTLHELPSLGFRYHASQRTYHCRSPQHTGFCLSFLPVLGKVPSSNPAPTRCVALGMSLNFFQTLFYLLCNEDIRTMSQVSSNYSPHPTSTYKHFKINKKMKNSDTTASTPGPPPKYCLTQQCISTQFYGPNSKWLPAKYICVAVSRLPFIMKHLGKGTGSRISDWHTYWVIY